MASETTKPPIETRTITVNGQRLRIAIRSGNGTRTPLLLMNGIGVATGYRSSLSQCETSHATTLSGPGSHGADRRRNLWGKGAHTARVRARVRTNRTPGQPTGLLLSNAGRSGLDEYPLARQTPAADTDSAWG